MIPATAFEPSFWECDIGGRGETGACDVWVAYEWPTSAMLEMAFCNQMQSIDFLSRGQSYRVSFPQAGDTRSSILASQVNLKTHMSRCARRWPSQHHKAVALEEQRTRASAQWQQWLQADWVWILLDGDEATAAEGRGPTSSTAGPEKIPYSLGDACPFEDCFWPPVLRRWPNKDLICASHPMSRRCSFSLKRLTVAESAASAQLSWEWQTLKDLWKHGGLGNRKLVGAYRVQNAGLVHGFVGARQAMLARLRAENFSDGQSREHSLQVRLLWHGTRTAASLIGICSDGFDRAHAQTCAYGKGCYFAASAAYSDKYTGTVKVPTEDTGRRAMLLAAVLTGELAQGSSGMYPPPVKPHSRTGERYENACDRVGSPSIYVTFKDHQALPCYVMIYE